MTEFEEKLKTLSEPRHIGDGVYVSYDGYHINIAANHHLNHVVALDPHVCEKLAAYIKSLNDLINSKNK